MNFAHFKFCEFWCFSLGKQARFTLNFCSGMPLRKVYELAFLWFGLPGPLLVTASDRQYRVFEASKLVTTKTLLLKHYYRHQGKRIEEKFCKTPRVLQNFGSQDAANSSPRLGHNTRKSADSTFGRSGMILPRSSFGRSGMILPWSSCKCQEQPSEHQGFQGQCEPSKSEKSCWNAENTKFRCHLVVLRVASYSCIFVVVVL